MKNITQQIKVIFLGILLATGLSYAFAWTGPSQSPPAGNISAPINVSANAQGKLGALGVGISTPTSGSMLDVNGILLANNLGVTGTSYFDGSIQIADGSQGNGKVLQSNASGTASWVATSSLGIGASGSGVTKIVAGSNVTISPTTGVGQVTVNSIPPAQSLPVSGGCYLTGTGSSADGYRPIYVGWGNATGGSGDGSTGRLDGAGCSCPSGYGEVTSGSLPTDAIWYNTGYLCVLN